MRISDWSSDVCSSDLLRPRPSMAVRRQAASSLHDALQEASLRAWRYTTGAEVRAPVSLCFRIAQNVAIDFARAQNRAPFTTHECEVEQHATDDPGPQPFAVATQEDRKSTRLNYSH